MFFVSFDVHVQQEGSLWRRSASIGAEAPMEHLVEHDY